MRRMVLVDDDPLLLESGAAWVASRVSKRSRRDADDDREFRSLVEHPDEREEMWARDAARRTGGRRSRRTHRRRGALSGDSARSNR